MLVALLSRGHALIEGVPGTGKTLAVRAFAAALGLPLRRIQFTPDLMPSDVVGTTVFNPQTATFSVRPGPINANVVLADEINRTPPKTQAALLEAMEEARVTIDGTPITLAAAVHRLRDAESDRVRRDLSVSRGATRSFCGEDFDRLSRARTRVGAARARRRGF